MSLQTLSKLHLFAKNTDANASLRGYQYQILKTLETWVSNYFNSVDEEIFCDFEEDIFQKNQLSNTAKFRQIKLYSRNFSFSSEEIQKCISHFFMLDVKTDYLSLEKEFIFEANTSIARSQSGNDAELLKEWKNNQENLNEDLLNRCVAKVKEIITQYIQDQSEALNGKQDQSIIDDALKVFQALTETDWQNFVKKIKWLFLELSAEEEFAMIKQDIETLLLNLPFQIDEKNISAVFGLLHKVIWDKASMQNPEERKLTLKELKEHLLQSASEEDIWYWQVVEKWKDVKVIEGFYVGEFLEMIDAVRYCRVSNHLSQHDEYWLELLKLYISNAEIIDSFKLNAIYEFLWLSFRPVDIYSAPAGSLIGYKDYFQTYYNDFDKFRNAKEIENAQNLLNIAMASHHSKLSDLELNQLQEWFQVMGETISSRLTLETNPHEICYLQENLCMHHLAIKSFFPQSKVDINSIIESLESILNHLEKASLYNVSDLSFRLNSSIQLFIYVDSRQDEELIETLEAYSQKLNPVVSAREGSFKAAKVEVERGIQYLNSENPKHLLKALNCFHHAKDAWLQQESIDGFVLAVLNIAQLYSAMGMNLAAKYYALCGLWMSTHNDNQQLLKRIADSFAMIFYVEFKQGSWMNAILAFHDYLDARENFEPAQLDLEKDVKFLKIIADFTILLHASGKLTPQLYVLIDAQINLLGNTGQDLKNSLLPGVEKQFPTDISLKEMLESRLTDKPLTDLGSVRIINFNALGSTWEVSFANDYETTAIAEEFVAILQIMLTEITLSKQDFHLVRSNIKIELELKLATSPIQHPTNEEYNWKVSIEFFDGQESKEIIFNTAKKAISLMYILDEISLLPEKEFEAVFTSLFKDQNLSGKTLTLNSYQKMYRYIYNKETFDSLHRNHFDPADIPFLSLPKENLFMKWEDGFSPKYNQQQALDNVKGRFKNSHKRIHITIEKLKQNKDFHVFINQLRQNGWADWQIIISIKNFIVDYKTKRAIENQSFQNEEEYRQALDKKFFEIHELDEKDCYIEFPLEAFQSDEFHFQLNNTIMLILSSFGLENKAKFPNLTSIKEFLDVRFNMVNDISNEENPLADIIQN